MTPNHPTRRLLARRLRELRFKRSWPQETLAAQAGLHRTYISGIERAERNIGLDNVEKLAAKQQERGHGFHYRYQLLFIERLNRHVERLGQQRFSSGDYGLL